MGRTKPIPNKDELVADYCDKQLSVVEMCQKYNISGQVMRKWMKIHDIPLRSHKETCQIVNIRNAAPRENKKRSHELLADYDWLYQKRVYERLSKEKIAELAGCSTNLVNRYLKKHDITEFKLNESELSVKSKLENKDLLLELYDSLTMREIAEKIGSSSATISLAFKRLGLEAKEPNSHDRKFQRISNGHQEIVDYIQSIISDEIIINNRSIFGKEIDIVIPSKRLAIEYNGLFYHCEYKDQKGKDYHISKTNLCRENGYSLFHIFSDQWEQKPDIVKSMICSKLGVIPHRKYARKLDIRPVDQVFSREFFNNNHIQGRDNSTFSFGLFENDICYAVMSFSKPRFNFKFEIELVRFACLLNHTIVGGFSRLLNHAQKTIGFKTLISYSDNTYSDGNVYKANGFECFRKNGPGYWYVDPSLKNRYPRTMFTKDQIKKKFGITTTDLTESEIMKILKFRKLWHCGTIAWTKQW